MALCGHHIKACIPKPRLRWAAPSILVLGTMLLICDHLIITYVGIKAGFAFSQLTLVAAIAILNSFQAPQSIPTRYRDNVLHAIAQHNLLFLFIFLVAFNSGIMFHALCPLLIPHDEVSAILVNIPYIFAVAGLSMFHSMNKFYLLHIGLILWGAALILFTSFGAPVLIPAILILYFTAGTFDLFWWTIGTTGHNLIRNPAALFGAILGVNILGVLAGGLFTTFLVSAGVSVQIIIQSGVVVILLTTLLLNLINKKLSPLLIELEFLEKPQWTAPEDTVTSAIRKLLSPREMDVFKLLRNGLRDKDISGQLNISLDTVKSHNRKIYAKLGLKNRVELRQQFPRNK